MPEIIQLEHEQFKSQACSFPLTLVCDGIKTPENVGMLFRLAEAFGVEQIVLCGESATPPSAKIRKTARSCDKTVKWSYTNNIEDALTALVNYRLVALEITNNSTPLPLFKIGSSQPIALVIGAEAHGVSEKALKLCHSAVDIPMYGKNSSLNVATATGIALYAITNLFS